LSKDDYLREYRKTFRLSTFSFVLWVNKLFNPIKGAKPTTFNDDAYNI